MMMTADDLARFHKVARMLEDDLTEAYFSARRQFGSDVAGAVLVTLLRQNLNKEPNQWPPPVELVGQVNAVLMDKGLA